MHVQGSFRRTIFFSFSEILSDTKDWATATATPSNELRRFLGINCQQENFLNKEVKQYTWNINTLSHLKYVIFILLCKF